MALLVLTATLPNRVAVVIFWNHRGLSGDSHIIWLFGGPCGLTPRRRCRPGSGATRAEPVFPTEREGPARGRRRHAVAVEALAPPDAARVAIRIATRVATVYTNAPKRRREARSSHLCTLLRSQGHSQPMPTAQQCTQMPQNGAERPFWPICVHSRDPPARSRDRAGPRVPRHRRPHGPRDTKALRPEAHAVKAPARPIAWPFRMPSASWRRTRPWRWRCRGGPPWLG